MDNINLKGSHYNIGMKMGNYFIEKKSKFPIKLHKFQSEFGKESGKILKKLFPEISEEIKGITDVLKIDNELFTSLLFCAGCCLIIRENHNVETRGCTAFSFIKNEKIFYGRNNDLPPYLKKVSKSIFYKPEGKNNFILNTSSFVNGEEGINEHGLVAAMTFVKPLKEEIKPGINSLLLVRLILENCKTTDEGLKLIKEVPIASSCNILLADKKTNMLVAECNSSEINIRYPEKTESGEAFIVTVNHFTSEKMFKHDGSNRNIYSSKKRYETAYESLKYKNSNNPVKFTKSLLSGQYGFICQYSKKIKFETIWSTIFDISDSKVYLAPGNPSKIEYIQDDRMKSYFKN